MYASIHSDFCIRSSCASLRCERAVVRRFFRGPKIATSSGCNTCEVWGGSIRSEIRFCIQCDIKLPLIWLSWPSQIRSLCCSCLFESVAFSLVEGSKTRFSYSNPWRLLVHPFVFAEKCHLLITSFRIQLCSMFCPLKIIRGLIAVLSIQMHSTAETHSCLPGCAWKRVLSVESTIIHVDCIVLTENPVSSIL